MCDLVGELGFRLAKFACFNHVTVVSKFQAAALGIGPAEERPAKTVLFIKCGKMVKSELFRLFQSDHLVQMAL